MQIQDNMQKSSVSSYEIDIFSSHREMSVITLRIFITVISHLVADYVLSIIYLSVCVSVCNQVL